MSRFTTCSLTILLAFAPAALAVDGTVLINQSTITNGLPGCPTGGHFPIIICQAGSYRLSGNLTVPDANTDAIDIHADNVTIDLNGFSIIGPIVCSGFPTVAASSCNGQGTGSGIASSNANTVVLNGDIHGMGQCGINLGRDSRVENVHASSNGSCGIQVSDSSKISSSRANYNGDTGIVTQGGGSVVSGNLVNGNAGFGIIVGCPSLIEDNTVTSSGSGPGILNGPGCVKINNLGF